MGKQALDDTAKPQFRPADIVRAAELAVACMLAYWATTSGLSRLVDSATDLLGGMWAAIAATFVFRNSDAASVAAGIGRLISTCVGFALCLGYLWFWPATPWGMALLLAVGAIIMALSGRRDDIITMAITVIVVMVVAEITPRDAWLQPILRLGDTIVGVAIGISCRRAGALIAGERAKPV